MERTRVLAIILSITGLLGCTTLARDALWQQVEEAIGKGLPQTAIAVLAEIIPAALEADAHAEAIRAIAHKIVLEGQIQGGHAEEKIVRLQAEIEQAPEAMKPVMESILAHWFWQYFQQNRYRFLARTQTAEPPGEDFTTWDLARILTEIDSHFTVALAADAALKAIPIVEYDDLLEGGTMPDSFRPTLWDFVAYDALSFYTAGEQGATQPQDSFEIGAEGPIFAPVREFLAWRPQTSDADSAKLKAVGLYQALLSAHEDDVDPNAFADADLQRLAFGNNMAVGPEKSARYRVALERFVGRWSVHPIAARALYQWARVVQGEGDFVAAHALAGRGRDGYPKSIGAAQCHNLILEIEAQSASVTTERVWNDPLPEIHLTYRNVDAVYFRAVPYDFLAKGRSTSDSLSLQEERALLSRTPVLEWETVLPETSDYQQRTEILPAPEGLKRGGYYLIASHDSAFRNDHSNRVSTVPIWVSDLALVMRRHTYYGVVEGFVLEARAGAPLQGRRVTRWLRDNQTNRFTPDARTETDANGMFSFSFADEQRYLRYFLVAEDEGDVLAGEEKYHYGSGSPSTSATERAVFFTDRSIYRPGQTIRYKGICIRSDPARDTYQTLTRKGLTVIFLDTNGQEIARRLHRSNDYGSFSGSFTAPRDRLLGRMTLRTENGPSGYVQVNVEEYKRPTFQVTLNAPEQAPKLTEEVTVSGKATAYTGAAIGGAQVSWRVERSVQFPPWCWWCRWFYPSTEIVSIAHGTTTSAADGSFHIAFVAKPDLAQLEENEPTFRYQVHADVTDISGETRSGDRSVRVGYTALQADVAADAWQTPDRPVLLTILTQSLDGEAEPAAGDLSIYALEQPERPARAALQTNPRRRIGAGEPEMDPANPDTWPLAERVSRQAFATDALGLAELAASLGAGVYRAILETQDRFGKPVTARHTFQVVDPTARHLAVSVANHFAAPTWSVQPGDTFEALWGTGYDRGRAFVELELRGELLRAWWTEPTRTQERIEQEVTEDMRGGFTLRVTYVRENRLYLNERIVDVPWSNKELSIRWERFRSALEPGQQERWTAVISGPDANKAVAEMVAGLYDASLDQFLPHEWIQAFSGFRQERQRLSSLFENRALAFRQTRDSGWTSGISGVVISYRQYPPELIYHFQTFLARSLGRGRAGPESDTFAEMAPAPAAAASTPEEPSGPDLDQVPVRTNFDETAFFFPHLSSDAQGVVRMEFTMPEALTQWRFMGFAHDNDMRSGFLMDTAVTAKELMVQANPPRFVREGDEIEFTVKVTNQSAARQTGMVRLTLADARTQASRDQSLGNLSPEQPFDVPSKESRSYSWRLTIPDGAEMLTYRAVGATDRLSDGEEAFLPVLSRRILVQESLPLPIRGPQTKEFEFTKLLESGQSTSLIHQSLTVQMVSQPAWYAVLALPYLMEYPHECSEQIFNRLYANALAAYIANADPRIRSIFDQWRGTPTLDSPLEQNEDLKSVALEETPWVRQAISESQARRNVGILFDKNRLRDEMSLTHFKLQQRQLSSGLWSWFPGGRGSEYITLYITTGFGRLRHLGLRDLDVGPALKSLDALDQWMHRRYLDIRGDNNLDDNHLSSLVAFYLYGRSFFIDDQAVGPAYQEAWAYWISQAQRYWLQLRWRQSQAHVAIALKRLGNLTTPQAIVASLRERSVRDEELGMFWRDLERSWWWYRAPIETQAMMIEVFDEVAGDAEAVEDCKVWLLKQKQTQAWKTTKATADAVYGLLLRGANLLSSTALVEVALGGEWIEPQQVEAGTGFYQERFVRQEIQPAMGRITVRKIDAGVSWGSVHWQYLEDLSKVTPYEGTPLQLKKTLYVKENTTQGQVLQPITGPLAVGDELVVRIELRVDRDMEYIHMKDQRGSGTEPVNVLSRYRYQDGLGYYESTRDTATHFFMGYLPKGVYVFEYSTRIQHRGRYQSGITTIQSMYAPEFNSHSESVELEVR